MDLFLFYKQTFVYNRYLNQEYKNHTRCCSNERFLSNDSSYCLFEEYNIYVNFNNILKVLIITKKLRILKLEYFY